MSIPILNVTPVSRPDLLKPPPATQPPLLITDPAAFGSNSIHPQRPLDRHDQEIIATCLKNMDIYECPEEYKDAFILEYTKSLTRSIAGVQPMTGPTGLAFIRNPFFTPRPVPESWTESQPPGFLELKQDIRAIFGEGNAERRGLIIDEYTDKVCVSCTSRNLPRRNQWAKTLDTEVLRTLDYISETGSWDNAEIPNRYVIVHHDQLHKVPPSLLDATLTSPYMPQDRALIGWKASNFEAPIYYMPYVPLHHFNGNGHKSRNSHRYGLAASCGWRTEDINKRFVWNVDLTGK